LDLAANEPDRFVVIDGRASISQVAEMIREAIPSHV
jgi:thymidylate kinase